MKRVVASLLVCVFVLTGIAAAGLGSDKAAYVGGTVNTIKEGTQGKFSTHDEKAATFNYGGGTLSIPYDRVNSIEYGQKAGRRVGVAIMVSPFALLSKKRKHFLTIGYTDDQDKQQAIVLELGKDVVRTTLATIEARTGRKIEYQDDEARNAGRGN